jgi:hypothetical protein
VKPSAVDGDVHDDDDGDVHEEDANTVPRPSERRLRSACDVAASETASTSPAPPLMGGDQVWDGTSESDSDYSCRIEQLR